MGPCPALHQKLWCLIDHLPLLGIMLISGLAKTAIVRYGGQRSHHALVPFALGIIVGEFLTGSVWIWNYHWATDLQFQHQLNGRE